MKHSHSDFATAAAYADPRAVEARVKAFLPMVRKAAWHIYGRGRDGLEIEDLIQAGLLALTQCARRHDRPDDDGFAAYAKLRVRGAMFDVLRKMSPASRGSIRRQRELADARTAFAGMHGRPPMASELADATGLSAAEVAASDGTRISLTALDGAYDDADPAFAEPSGDALSQLIDQEAAGELTTAIAALPERLQTVLQLYFVEELNLAEIAAVLGVSIPRVHQLKAAAIEKLRALVES